MTLLGFKLCVKRSWLWCKKNWKFFVGLMVPIVLSIIFRRQINPQKLLDKIRDDHDKEVDILNRSHQKEIEDRENAKKRYDIAIKELEEKYRNSEGELDKKKKKEVEKALKNHSSDPDEITRRIAEITGFEIHVS